MKKKFLGLPGLCLCLFFGLLTGCSLLKAPNSDEFAYHTYLVEADIQEDAFPSIDSLKIVKDGNHASSVVLMLYARNYAELGKLKNELALQGVYIKEIRRVHE